ncbi:MAG: UDP-N-acetylmuramoyl-L-alanyl-D-glutamate--2,6-diaminopimelate ligase [Candidatus Protochlamydia sp.]|nr:UDP-N-acetylmuramoyl-L-alanyl-D-glutamate--2,6-diaminopimelate ligase [Candidatus Protochlamydia sp.]
MKIKQLFKAINECQIIGSKESIVTGISANSKAIGPGHLFMAIRGKTFDGSHFVPDAIRAGASAILTDLYDPSLKNVIQIIHPNVADIEALVAAEFYGHPSNDLLMVGITGTNGKTTSSFIIKHLLDNFFGPCGLIGTIEYIVGRQHYEASRTTPDAVTNQKLLREMCRAGSKSAVMETTSHALDQGRVGQIDFDTAIFTNLTLDHLDYHSTIEQYAKAKKSLFENLGNLKKTKKLAKWALINQDSSWADYMKEGCQANCLTYGIDNPADLQAHSIRLMQNGSYAKVSYDGKTQEFFWPFTGRFNVYNCLAALGVIVTRGVGLSEAAEKMSSLPPVRGRMQRIPNQLELEIYVDFAHSDDALASVLSCLSELRKGRLIVVFGCGGDRDKAKRPKMAQACERFADFAIVTTDNPRSEDPELICQEIVKGFTNKALYCVELDRREAIKKAIEIGKKGDTILIAGKGHEPYQVFAHQTLEFDDAKVAAEIVYTN